jgi:hypothetical protein
MDEIVCCNCGLFFTPDPRNKNQKYCGKAQCQKARRAAWQRNRMATDPGYRGDQKLSRQKWARSHPDYWRNYRTQNPQITSRNRVLQRVRNRRRLKQKPLIAKMDASKCLAFKPFGQFYLVPVIAKMDALKVRIYPISG